MVHKGLVLKFSLEISGIANAIPRFYADEGSLFTVWTPEGAYRRLVIHRHSGLTISIHQHSSVSLALVNLHRVVAEEAVADFKNAQSSFKRLSTEELHQWIDEYIWTPDSKSIEFFDSLS